MKRLLIILNILFLLVGLQLDAQVSNTGLPIHIGTGMTITVQGNISSAGDITNEGQIIATGDLLISGVYSGSGTIRVEGNGGQISVGYAVFNFIMNGSGTYSLLNDLKVDNLELSGGLIDASTNSVWITSGGSLAGGDASSYVSGRLIQGGSSLFYPIGKAGVYTPVNLLNVTGTTPEIGIESFEGDVAGTLGSPNLVELSTTRYWDISIAGGSFTGGQISLPTISETLSPFDDFVVAYAGADKVFSNVGSSSKVGDASAGSITSNENVLEGFVTLAVQASDTQAPVATINNLSTNDATPSLSGTIDDATASLSVEVDGNSFTATVLPTGIWVVNNDVIFPALSDGSYDVILHSIDSVLNTNDQTFVGALFIDTTPATGTVASQSTSDPTPGLTGTVDEADITVTVTINGQEYPATVTGTSWSIADNTVQSLADGVYDVTVNTVDAVGNTNSQTVTGALSIDATAPVVTVTETVAGTSTPTLRGTIDDPTATMEVSVNGQTYTNITITGTDWSVVTTTAIPDGTYDVAATATDSLNNVGTDATTDELEINTVELLVRVDTKVTNDRTPQLTGKVSDPGASVSVQVAGNSYTTTNNGNGTWTLADNTISPQLNAGTYDVVATATEGARTGTDNTSNELTIDLSAPKIRVFEIESYNARPAIYGLVDDKNAVVTLTVGGVDYTAAIIQDTVWIVQQGVIAPLPVGVTNVSVRARDVAGNVGTDEGTVRILPGQVVARPATEVSPLSFRANWSSATGVDKYLLTVSRERNARERLILEDQAVTDTSLTINNLRYSTSYYYRVRVVYQSGDTSNYSNIIPVRTTLDPQTRLDSLALVNIYNQTRGNLWKERGDWLQARLYNWRGVTVEGTRVTGVDLKDNNLTGTIPAITEGLTQLRTLNLSGNELTGVGALTSLTALESLDLTNNRLDFVQISNQQGNGYTVAYSPQKAVLQRIRTLQQIGNSYTINREVAGGEAYIWTKNGQSISQTTATFTLAIEDFDVEGDYVAQVTSSLVPGLTLTTRAVALRVSSLTRDSTALINIRAALITSSSTIGNWPTQVMSQWGGVTITNERVTGINLSGMNLGNELPDDILDIANLQTVNLSNNQITAIPDMTSLALTQLNVSSNRLTFESLEPNVGVTGITYAPQAQIGPERNDTIPRGEEVFYYMKTGGDNLSYQWFKGSVPITGATEDFYSINDIAYEDMAVYHAEATSPNVPNLTLRSMDKRLTAVADIEYFPSFSYADGVRGFLEEGQGILLRIKEQGPYDTVAVVPVRNQAVLFNNQVLGDYLLKVDTEDDYIQTKEYNYSADSIGIDTVEFIPTHYIAALEWDNADPLLLRDYISDTLAMIRNPPPTTGDGQIRMTVESDLPDEEGGRLESRRRVRKAGCSLRRNTRVGGGRTEEEEEWELIAYQETDDEGNVDFGKLPTGLYRINIQYPGIPMDPDSFIEFEISEDEEQDGYVLAATVYEDGIQVEVVEELGWLIEYFKELNVYPNPADDHITISYAKLNSKHVMYQLTDLSGRIQQEGSLDKGHHLTHELDTRAMKDGLYLLRLFDTTDAGRHLATYKLIIRH